MALSDEVLSGKLILLFEAMDKVPMTKEDYAKSLAKIINDQIKTATVSIGITVQVDPVTHAGATTSPGALT